MPVIKLSTKINRNKPIVYNLLKNMHDFPTFMRDIKKLEIIKKDNNKLITSWEVEIDGANVIWKEEDSFNDKEMSLKFRMIEGDYKEYEGEWRLENTLSGSKINLTVYFDWGVPALEKLVGNILEKKARKALRSMLKAIKQNLEKK